MRIYSEIENLKEVILHRPGKELENLTPEYLPQLLFDDIPHLEGAIKEHDKFSKALKENGSKVYYIEDLICESLTNDEIKMNFIVGFLRESGIISNDVKKSIFNYLMLLESKEMVDKVISGLRKDEVNLKKNSYFKGLIDKEYPFLLDPMPNLYFTRDMATVIAQGVSLNSMFFRVRKRETFLMKFIFENNKNFKTNNYWYEKDIPFSIEGGDILILSKDVLAIGCTQRTTPEAIEIIAKRIFESEESFKKILAFSLPDKRAFMHLDTVLTMVDYDKFTIYSEIEKDLKIFELTKGKDGNINKKELSRKLSKVLESALNVDYIDLIKCGDGDKVISGREQWNDAANTLAVAPGKVITYERNFITNELLDKKGVKIIPLEGSELLRGRGGPRCMSMPITRE